MPGDAHVDSAAAPATAFDADCQRFATRKGIARFAIFGLSIGGLIVQIAVAEHRHRG